MMDRSTIESENIEQGEGYMKKSFEEIMRELKSLLRAEKERDFDFKRELQESGNRGKKLKMQIKELESIEADLVPLVQKEIIKLGSSIAELKEKLRFTEKSNKEKIARIEQKIQNKEKKLSILNNEMEEYDKSKDPESFQTYMEDVKNRCEGLKLFEKGYQECRNNNFDEAIRYYSRVIELDPENAMAYSGRGNAYLELEDYNNAIKDYNEAIELDPENAMAYSNRGTAFSYLGEYQMAVSDFNKVIELDSGNTSAFMNRGRAHFKSKEYNDAVKDFDKVIELDPEDHIAFYNRGRAYFRAKKYLEAINDYCEAVNLDPKYTLAYNNRGNVYYELEEFENAIIDYSRAIKLDPEFSLAYYNRGNVYCRMNECHNAINDYNKAIELDPENTMAYINRGTANFKLKQYDEVIKDYNKAIEMDPMDALAYFNRGSAYYKLGEYQNAINDYNKAIELNPLDSKAYYDRGRAYSRMGDYTNAKNDYNKSMELDPNDLSLLNLMEINIIQGDWEKNMEYIKEVDTDMVNDRYQPVFLYLKNITLKLHDLDVSECEREFHSILEKEFKLTWSLDEIESWIKDADLAEDKKGFIMEKTEMIKKLRVFH